MGGKTSQSTQSVSIPPEVLARYNAVNTRAEQVAQRPFQQYTEQFVAPLTGTQQAGIQGTTSGANLAQPFFGAGTGLTMAGAQDVGPLTQGQIAYYENPYIESVARPTYQALRQQQQEEMMGQTANAIRAGAFGGDRAGLVAANLARQQQLGTAQALAPIYAQGYGQAVQTAAGQQGVVAADLARRMQAGQQIAGLGAGAQQAALQGAQAQLAAGTAEQQTQQADLTARYNQFLQEQGYPFQVAQFLANIAMGTGALSGSTTTTTQPSSFFSDRRLKANVEEIGKLKDGQKLYRYTMADGRTHIGLMADEVEKHHPDAVGVAGGYKTVDYRAATDDAARHKKAYGGGLMPSSEGGAVTPSMAGEGYARGGQIAELKRLLTMHREMVPYGHSGLYGNPDPRKGPYSTTMREINVPSRPLAPTTITIRPLNYAADIPAGVPQYAAGGVVGYAAGGLPYSEASEEYVPEDISKPMTPQSLKPAGGATGPVQDPTVRDLMQMGRMAASIYAGGGFASGGLVPHMADGGGMDFDRIIAMQQGMYGQMGRPAGLNIPAGQPRDPVKSMEMLRPARAPEPVKTGLQELQESAKRGEDAYKMASGAYSTGKTALLGKAATPASGSTPAQPASPGLVGVGGEYRPGSGIAANPSRIMELFPDFGSGSQTTSPSSYPIPIPGMASGGVAGRLHYQDAGTVDPDPATTAELERRAAAQSGQRQQRFMQRAGFPTLPEGWDEPGQAVDASQAAREADLRRSRERFGQRVESAQNANEEAARQSTVPPAAPQNTPANESEPYNLVDPNTSFDPTAGSRIANPLDVIRIPFGFRPGETLQERANRAMGERSGLTPPVRQVEEGAAPLPPLPPPPPPPAPSPGVAGRQAPSLLNPIEVGPVAGQGRPDVTEEAPQPTGVVMEPATQQAPAGVAAAQAQQPATMSGGEGGRGLLGAVASENFLVPLLTGLGAMASSPSRYLGSAVLQGLGAGAQAYENVQTKQVERLKAYSDIASKSYNPDMNAFMVYDPNNSNRIIAIPNEVFQRNIRRGIQYNLAPNQPRAVPAVTPGQQVVAPVAPEAPKIAAPGTPLWSGLTQEQYDRAKRVSENLQSNPRAMRPNALSQEARAVMSPYASIQNSANIANSLTPELLKYASNLASLGSQELAGSAVAFARPLAEFWNSVMGAVGFSGAKIMPQQLGTMEAIDKTQLALAGQLARYGDQRSNQSLQQYIGANPGNLNSPNGRATIIANSLVTNQRARDLQNYAQSFKEAVRSETGSDELANLSGENLENEFSKSENARYQQESEAIQKMALQSIANGESFLSYVIKNAANMTKEERDEFEKIYGPGMMRYFR